MLAGTPAAGRATSWPRRSPPAASEQAIAGRPAAGPRADQRGRQRGVHRRLQRHPAGRRGDRGRRRRVRARAGAPARLRGRAGRRGSARGGVSPAGRPRVGRGRPRDPRRDGRACSTKQGYAGMSMEAVAEAAGVGKTTVYRRYRDKADLVTAAIAAMPGAARSCPTRATPARTCSSCSSAFVRSKERVQSMRLLGHAVGRARSATPSCVQAVPRAGDRAAPPDDGRRAAARSGARRAARRPRPGAGHRDDGRRALRPAVQRRGRSRATGRGRSSTRSGRAGSSGSDSGRSEPAHCHSESPSASA